jgi:hypothetical protein
MDKNKKILFCTTIFLIFVWLLPSCGTTRFYKGPERPESEIAVLKNPFSFPGTIEKIDNTELSWTMPAFVHLLPGFHTIYVKPLNADRGTLFKIGHFFEAGHVYELQGEDEQIGRYDPYFDFNFRSFFGWVKDITEQKK